MTTIQLVKRNVLVFTRDRGAVFFSLLAMIIVILLQGVFLGNLNVETLMELLEQYGGRRDAAADRESAQQLVMLWTIGGLLVVNSITVSLTVLGKMVSDREENRLMSFSVAPVKRVQIALGYILAAVLVSVVLCIMTMAIAEGYLWACGGTLPGVRAHAIVLGLIILNCCVYSIIMYLIALWVKSSGAWSGLATVAGTLVGFLGAIYLPMGSLPDAVGKVLKCLPILHGAALMREVITEQMLKSVFEGMHVQVLEEYREAMGISIVWNGEIINSWIQIGFLAGCGIIALAAAVLCMRFRKMTDR